MSDSDSPGTREVAHRVFAAEYEDATLTHREGEEERAPTYVVTPSGAKANRLFLAGVLTEVESVNEEMLRARIVDPTGAFVVYAGQYQPDERAFFERAEPPEFVAVTGKARTFQPEGTDTVYSSVRPESVNAVDADTRDRWAVDAAEATLTRVAAMARALREGADEDPAAAGLDPTGGIALALDHYGTAPAYLGALRDVALDAARVVAGERDEVRPLGVAPDAPGEADLDALANLPVEEFGRGTAAHAAAEPEKAEAAGSPGEVGPGETTADRTAGPAEATEPAGEDETGTAETGTAETGPAVAGSGAATTETGASETTETDAPETTETGASETTGAGASEPAEAGTPEPADVGGSETTEAEAGDTDDIGDFEPGDLGGAEEEAETAGSDGAGVDVEGAPDELYELDEEERRQVEEEHGTEFSTGTEVESPGEADVETPDAGDAEAGETAGSEAGSGGSAEPAGEETDSAGEEAELTGEETALPREGTEPAGEGVGSTGAEEAAEPDQETGPEAESAAGEDVEDVDLEAAVMEQMRELDDGDGADRAALIDAVSDATGADADAVEDAIQEALMGGQCYEPDEETLKPI